MKRAFPVLLLVFALSFLMCASLIGLGLDASAQSTQASNNNGHTGYWLNHSLSFNTYGQFQVNETLHELSNSTTGISTVTFGMPSAYSGHIVGLRSFVSSGSTRENASVSQTLNNGTLEMTVSFQPGLPSGTNATVNLAFYVVKTFKALNASNYNVSLLFYPSVSININRLVSSIVLPYLTTHVADGTPLRKAGFSQTVNGTAEIWALTLTNSSIVKPGFASTNVFSASTNSGDIDYFLIQRRLSVDSSGSIMVQDTINVRNLGKNSITTLGYIPLTNATSVTLLPASQTLLSNVKSVPVIANQLNLADISGSLQGGSSETILLQYSLASQYWSFSGGVYNVSIPSTAPVGAIIDTFQINAQTAPGIILTSSGGIPSVSALNSTGLSSPFTFSYRIGIGSSFGSALPIAVMMFIVVFVTALIFRPREEVSEAVTTTFDALVKLVEDKVSGTNDILSELKAKGSSVNRNDLVTARLRIDELRSKSASRIGVLRSQISSPNVSVQAGLNQVSANDRDYDRSVRDIINVYDQFVSKKMKEDTFSRVLQNSDRRMQQVTNSYLDSVHDLREEYESEG